MLLRKLGLFLITFSGLCFSSPFEVCLLVTQDPLERQVCQRPPNMATSEDSVLVDRHIVVIL